MLERRDAFIFGAFFLLWMASPGIAQAQTMSKVQQTLMQAATKADDNDCKSALQILAALTPTRDFAALPDKLKAFTFDFATRCALDEKQDDTAYRYAIEGSEFDDATALALRVRLYYEIFVKPDPGSATAIAERIATKYSDELNDIPASWYYRLDRQLRDAHDDANRRQLLIRLSSPDYIPAEIGTNGDPFRRNYAMLLAQAGDLAGAAAIVAQIQDGTVLMQISLDPNLRYMLPADFDARMAVERDLAHLRDIAASHPGSINVILRISGYLRILGRNDEALATLEAARPDGPQGQAFTDLDGKRNWWWDAMARAYTVSGRYDDAVAALRAGVEAKESGHKNVSQTLNLAYLHVQFGHHAAALETLKDFDIREGAVSPYGMMVFTLARGCARFHSDDIAGAKADRDYAVAHEHDSIENLTELLLCMNDIDAAAAVMIRRLDDPDKRIDALMMLSDFDPQPHLVPIDLTDGHIAELKARPDVKAAVARAGGTRRIRLQREIG